MKEVGWIIITLWGWFCGGMVAWMLLKYEMRQLRLVCFRQHELLVRINAGEFNVDPEGEEESYEPSGRE